MKFFKSIILISIIFWASVSKAQQAANVFGDHMVLQQNMPVPVWGTGLPDSKIKVEFNGKQVTTKTGKDGQWKVILPAMKTGGPYQMKITGKKTTVFNDVLIGEVWLCSGQSNMDMTVAREDRYWCGVYNEKQEVENANYPQIRFYDTEFTTSEEPQKNVVGQWELCSPKTIGHLSATAYFFARDIYEKYKVPIGLITTAYGASTAEAWISKPSLQSHPQLTYLLEEYEKKGKAYDTSVVAQRKYKQAYEIYQAEAKKAAAEGKDSPREPKNPNPRKDQHSPYVLYNGMIAPLVPYAIRGALWYQGESNGPTAKLYASIMELLIQDWRKAWSQGDFPFFYVQLANHQALIKEPVKDDPMVLVREGQLKNLSIKNTGMVVAIDNANPDDPENIHPKNKQEIGRRLALIARTKVYGDSVIFSGPVFNKMTVEGSTLRLTFDYGNGMKAKGDSLSGFAIAGEDRKFVWAKARIEGNSVVVSSPLVKAPVSARYGWGKNPQVNLYNAAGLPASPFRTDLDQ
ncbi:MAG TPA: sialate O-acetylesterase [Cyclobacteriaceae bacterium]|nr:sialate O-acetylesterase [Cyclobacteriaceae bacterium]